MKPSISLRKALTDPQLLGSVLAGDTWRSWRCSDDRLDGRGIDG